MFCGKYAKREDGTDDDFVYIAYNMHWESHTFALPKLPKGLRWEAVLASDSAFLTRYDQELKEKQENIEVWDRSVLILRSISEK